MKSFGIEDDVEVYDWGFFGGVPGSSAKTRRYFGRARRSRAKAQAKSHSLTSPIGRIRDIGWQEKSLTY